MPFFLISVGSLALPGAFVFRFFKSFRGIARQLPCCLATLFFRGLYFSSFHVFGLQLSISVCARLRQALALFQQLPQSVFLLCSLLVRDKRPLASFFVLLLAPFQTFAPVLLAAVCKKKSLLGFCGNYPVATRVCNVRSVTFARLFIVGH